MCCKSQLLSQAVCMVPGVTRSSKQIYFSTFISRLFQDLFSPVCFLFWEVIKVSWVFLHILCSNTLGVTDGLCQVSRDGRGHDGPGSSQEPWVCY